MRCAAPLAAPPRLRCERRRSVRAGATQAREEQPAAARVALLRLKLGSSPLMCPTGLLRAAAAATTERLYVVCEPGAASGADEARAGSTARGDCDTDELTLRFLTLGFDAVAAAAPRLDARFLLPCAGWDEAAVAALHDVDTAFVSLADASADSDAAAATPRRVLYHDADVAAVEAPAPAPASALQALRAALRHLLRLRLPQPGRLVLGRRPPYAAVVVAGTFDRLHAGHRLLLSSAALVCAPGGTLFVGVTGDKLTARKRRRELLQPYAVREAAALDFLRGVRPGLRVLSGELDDPLRGIKGQPEVDAIVVSREVVGCVLMLNRYKRAAALLAALLPPLRALLRARMQGLSPYAVVVVDLVGGAAGKLSSTALREQDAQRLQ